MQQSLMPFRLGIVNVHRKGTNSAYYLFFVLTKTIYFLSIFHFNLKEIQSLLFKFFNE